MLKITIAAGSVNGLHKAIRSDGKIHLRVISDKEGSLALKATQNEALKFVSGLCNFKLLDFVYYLLDCEALSGKINYFLMSFPDAIF